jgi:hypothetical protein
LIKLYKEIHPQPHLRMRKRLSRKPVKRGWSRQGVPPRHGKCVSGPKSKTHTTITARTYYTG